MSNKRSIYEFRLNCDISQANQLIQSYINYNGFKLITKNGERYYRAGDAFFEGYKYFNYSIKGNNLVILAWVRSVLGDISIEQKGITSINVLVMSYRDSLNILFQEIEKLNINSSNGGSMNNNSNKIVGYDPNTGQPIYNNNDNAMRFDPNTGQPIYNNNDNTMRYDPNTGRPIYNNNDNAMRFDPNTGQPINSNSNVDYTQNNNNFSQTFKSETTKKQEILCEVGFWISIFGVICSLIGIGIGLIIYLLDFYFASQGLKTRKKGKAIATIVLSIISILITVFQLMIMTLV